MSNATGSEQHEWNPGHSTFGWPEVGCFLRPQALLCDEAGPGYGQMLLSLTSLYRTWGADGFFVDPDLGHFPFLTSRFAEITGLGFRLSYLEDRTRIAESLRDDLLPTAGTAVAPANLREFPPFKGFMQEDAAHFFLLRKFDDASRSFDALDYLHVSAGNLSLDYSPCRIPITLFSTMAEDYCDRFVGAQPDVNREPHYWVLQRRAEVVPAPRSELELCWLLLQSCQRVLRLVDLAPDMVHPLDARFLSTLRSAHNSGDTATFQHGAYRYFAAANHSRVYLKVITRSLRRLGFPAAASRFAMQLESWDRSTSQLRMQLLVKCKAMSRLDPSIWNAFSERMSALSDTLRRAALSEIESVTGV